MIERRIDLQPCLRCITEGVLRSGEVAHARSAVMPAVITR